MAKLKVEWTNKAKAQLKQIHDYLKYEKNTPQGAANVKADLIQASKGVTYIRNSNIKVSRTEQDDLL